MNLTPEQIQDNWNELLSYIEDYIEQPRKDKLLEFNDNPNGNPYTGQEKLGPNKFIINKIKVINHRWIIADFSDGDYWGEVLLKYFVNEDKSFSFEVNQSLLYPKQ